MNISVGKSNRRGTKCKFRSYGSWADMKQRCNNPKIVNFELYGSRGIGYCKRWEKFDNFLEDMGDRPEGYTLGRINNDGNYCKENCRWESPKQQAYNRRTNHNLCLCGENKPVTEWAAQLGIKPVTLFGRLSRGWSDEETLTIPVGGTR